SNSVGTPELIVEASSGKVVQKFEFDEFGVKREAERKFMIPFGFAGGLYDEDTKLLRFGARDYDPEIGRWTSKDPILFNGGDTNLFGYVANDPINFIDPSGLKLNFTSSAAEATLRPVLEYLERSPAGAALIQQLDRSSTVYNLSIDNNNNPHQQGDDVCVDPSSTIYINTDKGIQAATLPRILAHELGHLTGSKDNGLLNMNNVNNFENPIMRPLEGFNRTGY
ncbi:MAG: RHS repeat domain-containing protein, partial [Bdellovibrio sp.]